MFVSSVIFLAGSDRPVNETKCAPSQSNNSDGTRADDVLSHSKWNQMPSTEVIPIRSDELEPRVGEFPGRLQLDQ
jgi:hypothetical protein